MPIIDEKTQNPIMSVINGMDPFPHGYPTNFPMLMQIETTS
jgi:hypothetical protein